jgi:hypothetical protein
MKTYLPISIMFMLIFMVTINVDSSADTIKLFEGSVMTGKIISEDRTFIVFANYYGSFRIKKTKIDDIYKTAAFTEDIAIQKKLKFPYNENEIKRNYLAGQDIKNGKKREPVTDEIKSAAKTPIQKDTKTEKTSLPVEKTSDGDHWRSGRLSFSGSFMYNLGSGSQALPYGYSGIFALDQGLDFTSGPRNPGIPGLRFEGGYVNFSKSSFSLYGFICGGGLMWAFPSMKNSWGCIILALIPGASFMTAKINRSYFGSGGGKAYDVNFAGQAILGYQKSFGVFSIFLHARYLYIMGKGANYMSVGGEAGFGFNAW